MSNNQSNAITKPFGCHIIHFSITGLCYKVIEEDFVIVSPEISINGVDTAKWQMKVYPKLKRDGTFVFSVHLERLYFAPGPDNVWASSKIEIFGEEDNDEKSFSAYHEGYFKFTSCEVLCCSVADLLRLLEVDEYKHAELNIVVHLIVKSDSSIQRTNTPSDAGLRLLSSDLRNLLRTPADSDFTIITEDGKEIGCHKALLSARSCISNDYLQGKTDFPVKLNYEFINDALTYIYSGDVDAVANSASVRMYEWFSLMGVRGMEYYFRPLSSIFYYKFQGLRIKHDWEIPSDLVFEDPKKSDIFLPCYPEKSDILLSSYDGPLGNTCSRWSLTLYLNGIDNSKKYVSIIANIVEGSVPDMCCFTFALETAEGDVWYQRSVVLGDELCFQDDTHVGILEFISRESFETKIKQCDKFHAVLILEVYKYSDRLCGYMFEDDLPKVSIDYFYDCLSEDLAQMLDFKNCHSFDTFVEVEDGTSIGVHKCILNARAPTLKSMISEINNKLVINLSNMKRSVVLVVLRYIYSGKLVECGNRDISDVYNAAKLFNITDLEEKCSEKMRQLLNADTVCSALVFACETGDVKLKSSALHFIRENHRSVYQSAEWKALLGERPQFCNKVRAFVRCDLGFTESVCYTKA